MSGTVSPLWRRVPPDVATRLARSLDRALERRDGEVTLFFRADDVAVPGRRFAAMAEIFTGHRMPLNLAVVPAWLTPVRWTALQHHVASVPEIACWHQHGWRHRNHEPPPAKKQEFGPARSAAPIRRDVARGRERLQRLMGGAFCPVFTPPWNRCCRNALDVLADLEFDAVSRSQGGGPPLPPELLDLSVNVDLHTRREPDPAEGWRLMMKELEAGIRSGWCGVMLHHPLMNRAACDFLDLLLETTARRPRIHPATFRELIDAATRLNPKPANGPTGQPSL